ncbi:c-type cytochrome biogenesis protein CcmI [Octadecabacter sp. R77987]|uniref:c-type cytochrome biogenesis protein CcmI n=1 Tax=Octadecabacter sp. R77987 TaxID=3093874 RepID=UPI00366E1B65
MLFWVIICVIALLSGLALVAPLWRAAQTGESGHEDVALYRAQLAEVERDLARGVLAEDEAARTRTEIARRLLAADQAAGAVMGNASLGLSRGAGVAVLATTIALAVGIYIALGAFDSTGPYPDLSRADRIAAGNALRANRLSQPEAEAAYGTEGAVLAEIPPEYLAMIEQLRAVVPQNPDELQGWELLALHEARIGNYAAASRAQEQVLRLKGDAVTVADRIGLLDRLVTATNGYVTPEAEQVMLQVLEIDPRNVPARYYAGLLYAQTDRPDLALRLWRGVLESGDPQGLYVALANAQIADVAFAAGEEFDPASITPRGPVPAARGPSDEDIAAAADMSSEDRAQMIAGMVSQLSERLASEGGPASDWARLITALGVLNETERAQMILDEARTAFAGQEADLALIEDAAAQAGLGE